MKKLLILLCLPIIGLGQIKQFKMVSDKNIQEILINNQNDWYDDKAKRKANYNDATGNNLWIAYSDNNYIEQIGYYHNGKKNGEWVENGASSILIEIINYKDGMKDGLFKEYRYHSAGKGSDNLDIYYLYEIGNYKNNQKDSLWLEYWKPGTLRNAKEYINGEEVPYTNKMYHYNGNVRLEYIKKEEYLIRTWYFENGIIDREFIVGCGITVFDCTNKYYNESGKLAYTTTYLEENKAPGGNAVFIDKCWDGEEIEIECK